MKKIIAIACLLIFMFINGYAQDVTLQGPTQCNGGAVTGTWTVPCNVSAIMVEVYGGGGGAGGGGGGSNGGFFDTRGGGGGGGGGYTTISINVTPGSSFSYSIGAGGCGGGNGSDASSGDDGNNGGNSSFSGTDSGGGSVNLTANGGSRGTGGSGTEGSPGSGGVGGSASGGSTNTTGSSGTNGSGGNGGAGGNGAGPSGGSGGATTGANGTAYGGGGAGGGNSNGGVGAGGGILITFTTTAPPTVTPTISSTPATCTTPGSSSISNYDPNTTYVFTPTGPTVGGGGAISGMTPGTSYTVVAGTGNCASAPSASFSNAASGGPPAAPTVSSTPPSCTADGSSTISNYDGNLTYVFTPTGPTAGSGGAISGMVTGTSYTVEASDGSCNSTPSSAFSNGAQLSVPAVPTISSTSPTCTQDGSSTISNYDGNLTYTFTPSGPSAGSGGAISGMTTGTNYTVEASDGTCTSAPSASFSNGPAGGPPAAPTISSTPASCTADGSSTISNYDGNLTYIFTPTGPTAGSGGVISGMVAGTSYTVEANDGSCTSTPSSSFSNGAQLSVPAVPTISSTSPTCTQDGSSTISNYDGNLTYVFTPTGPTAGSGGAISGMVTGTSYTVEASDGTCTSAPSSSFTNDPAGGPPATPTISIDPPSCTADGSGTISNYDGNLTYIFTPTGPAAGSGGAISGMVAGTSYTVEASDGSCTSTPSSSFTIDEQLPVPTATITGTLTYCAGENTTLTASGGTGYTWTDAGGTNVGTTESVTVTQGTYTVEVVNASGCTVTADATVTEETDLEVTITGTLSYCAGGNTILTASGGASYSWSDGSVSADITVIQQGTYTVTATDGGCTGTASATVTELDLPIVDLGDDITACEDSLVILDAGAGYSSYDWDGGETTSTITAQNSGVYTVTVFNDDGCKITTSVEVEYEDCIEDNFTFYIPNAFTPGSNKRNDIFRPYFTNILDLKLTIFDRWGGVIYTETGLDSGWDGTQETLKVPQGVYAYVVEVSLAGGETRVYRGGVTLVR